ncbi:MFS transporter [Streptomyces sp. NPDC007088]|uniref:MFS transporter n=1 Tax=Streptomyces sp. NPDC007088 TaxID=3364773 RepID=UPI0036AF7B0E
MSYYLVSVAAESAGTSVTGLALPLVALTVLHATTLEVTLLIAAQEAPLAVTSLLAGVLTDRCRKRTVIAVSSVLGAAALATIPVAAALGLLTMPLLYCTAVSAAALTDIASIAAVSYLPTLSDGSPLTATARSGAASALSQTAGAYLTSGVSAVAGASRTLGVAVVARLAAAWAISRITIPEPAPAPRAAGSTPRHEIRAGLRYLLGQRMLRDLVAVNLLLSSTMTAVETLRLLIVVQQLHWSATTVAWVAGCGAAGAVAGSLAAVPLASALGSWGVGRCLVASAALIPLSQIPLIIAGPGPGWQIALAATLAVRQAASAALTVHSRSVRQAVCRPEMQGRQHATGSWLTRLPLPLVPLAAGAGVTLWGARPALAAALILACSACAVTALSPAGRLRTIPHPPPPTADTAPPTPMADSLVSVRTTIASPHLPTDREGARP